MCVTIAVTRSRSLSPLHSPAWCWLIRHPGCRKRSFDTVPQLASPDDLSNFGAIEDGESSGLADGRDAGLMGGTRITWHGDSVPGEYASAFDYF